MAEATMSIQARVSERLYRALEREAKEAGVSMNQVIREALMAKLGVK